MSIKCYECGKSMKETNINYHYTESGLDNVYLEGVTEFSCSGCDNSYVDIPEPINLHIMLSIALSLQDGMLTGPAIRFLRKEIGMSGKAFAEFIKVSPVTLSRWENDPADANKSESNDRLIRFAFQAMMCERLKMMLSWVEDQIQRNEVVTFRNKRVNIHTEAMKHLTMPNTECRCM